MNKTKPNYIDLGFANQMGFQLRDLVEHQLSDDLKFYGIANPDKLRFDWSDSCIEGHDTEFLDGSLENFSGIAVFDYQDNFIADGWMEFIHEGGFFIVYWEFVTTWNNDKKLKEKKEVGIPDHVWDKIPDAIKPNLEKEKMKNKV